MRPAAGRTAERIARAGGFVALAFVGPASAVAQSGGLASHPPMAERMVIETMPATPARGSIVWLYAQPAGGADIGLSLDGSAAEEPLHFERLGEGRFRSLLGIPLEGPDTLSVTLRLSTGAVTDTIDFGLAVRQPIYPHERLSVAPRFAELDGASRARVDRELAQSRAISRSTRARA